MTDTANLGITNVAAASSQKHVAVNEGWRTLDALSQIGVIDKDLSAPPGSPTDGDTYIVGASPTGLWAGQADNIAYYAEGAWFFYPPKNGWLAVVNDEGLLYLYDGAAWGGYASPLDSGSLADGSVTQLGVNATASTSNRLSVNSAGILFNRETDDVDVVLNKQAAGDVATLSYKTAFSTRAIVGLNGTDDYAINVSPDGSTFYQALHIDADNGHVGVGGASADATNALSVYGTNVLLNSPGSVDLKYNKNASGNDASMTFQTASSTKALLGLLGNDDFTLKIGGAFTTAFYVDEANAWTSFPQSRRLQFDSTINGNNIKQYIRALGTKFEFQKVQSDTALADGSSFLFNVCGGKNTGSPFWQGMHLGCSTVTEGGADRFPRYSFYWSYTNTADPTDLRFNFTPGNAGSMATQLAFNTQNGGDIWLNGNNICVGNTSKTATAKLDVDGAVRVKSYIVATVPSASSNGAGAMIYVSNETGGAVVAFSDGTNWRRVTDRAIIS